MPSIKFFRYNVRHAAALVILLSFSPLNTLYFPLHLPTFREYSNSYKIVIKMKPDCRIWMLSCHCAGESVLTHRTMCSAYSAALYRIL